MTDFKFTIDEINTVAFKLSVMGNLPAKATPQVRFVISEGKNGNGNGNGHTSMAWMFPAVPADDGFVKSEIYAPVGMFAEDKTYTGKLEVIIGHRYFVPTAGEVSFTRPLRVEVESITRAGDDDAYVEENVDVEAIVQSVIAEEESRPHVSRPAAVTKHEPAPQQRHVITASKPVITTKPAAPVVPLKETAKPVVQQPRPVIQQQQQRQPKPAQPVRPAAVKPQVTAKPSVLPPQPSRDAFKFKLKDMLAEGIKELWEDDEDESK